MWVILKMFCFEKSQKFSDFFETFPFFLIFLPIFR